MATKDTTIIPPRNDLQANGGYDKVQDPSIPAYDAKSGLLTDYGRNLGLKEVNLPGNLNSADASKIGSGSNITTPILSPYNSAGASLDAIGSITDSNKNALSEADKAEAADLEALKTDQTKGKSAIQTIFDRLRGTNQEKVDLYKKTGVNDARQQVDELTSQIEAEQLAARRKIDQVRTTFTGTTAGRDVEMARVNRESLSKLADLSIVQNAALRKYSTMKDIADRQIEAETEDLKTELDGLKFFYQENKDELTKKEDRLYTEKIKEKDRVYNETIADKKTLSDTKIDLLKSASSQGASTSVMQAIQNAKTPEDAVAAAGKYSGDILDRLYKQAQINKINSDIKANGNTDSLLSIDDAAKLGVPYGTTKAQAIASINGSQGKPAPLNPTQQNAARSAQQLLDKLNNNFKWTSAPIGINSIGFSLPGSNRKDFIVQFDNLKSLLSLDNVKLLKGQGAVSDAERRLLADASTKLNRSMSQKEFKATLEDVVRIFNKSSPEYQFVDTITSGSGSDTALSANAYANSLLK